MSFYEKDFSKMKNKIEGAKGELIARDFLLKKKYTILQMNYKIKLGEIDIIAKDKGTIVFVEVKSRQTFAYGRPVEAVDERKISKIKKVAEIFLMMSHNTYADVRFDVVEIVGDKINHIENAFC